jgi:hypothetical protein
MDPRKIEYIRAMGSPDFYIATGTTTFETYALGIGEYSLKATDRAIERLKVLLNEGKVVKIPKNLPYVEVREEDFIVDVLDNLETRRRIALNEIQVLTGQNAMTINVLESMDYLDSYMNLLAAGIFITDKNREDMYFDIIQKAQEVPNPGELKEGATFDEEQAYIEAKKKWDDAQANLKNLETYLNAKDKMGIVRYVRNTLAKANNDILDATSIEEIEKATAWYREIARKHWEPHHVNV